jgi:hypothetical protein
MINHCANVLNPPIRVISVYRIFFNVRISEIRIGLAVITPRVYALQVNSDRVIDFFALSDEDGWRIL